MHSYRITKYHQYNAEGYLYSPPEEWIDYSDIGKLVSLEDYLKIENEFIRTFLAICHYLQVDSLLISDLEIRTDSILTITNNEEVKTEQLPDIIKMLLRNDIWCRLYSKILQFHFGYDYYAYCVSNQSLDSFFKTYDTDLNIEQFVSPYLNLDQ